MLSCHFNYIHFWMFEKFCSEMKEVTRFKGSLEGWFEEVLVKLDVTEMEKRVISKEMIRIRIIKLGLSLKWKGRLIWYKFRVKKDAENLSWGGKDEREDKGTRNKNKKVQQHWVLDCKTRAMERWWFLCRYKIFSYHGWKQLALVFDQP